MKTSESGRRCSELNPIIIIVFSIYLFYCLLLPSLFFLTLIFNRKIPRQLVYFVNEKCTITSVLKDAA